MVQSLEKERTNLGVWKERTNLDMGKERTYSGVGKRKDKFRRRKKGQIQASEKKDKFRRRGRKGQSQAQR